MQTIQDVLTQAKEEKQKRLEILANHILAGVKIIDIDNTYIEDGVSIGEGTVIYPNTYIHSDVKIGSNCKIGPFAYIRPNSVIGNNAKVGDFVEVKNSTIGDGTKMSHLTYVGDANVGNNVNFGCGTVLVNYDGKSKYRSTIEDNAFIGCNTNLVSPVTVKKNAYIAAGSTITDEVPEGSLAIARQRQVIKENWVAKKDSLKK